jgi:hypothetical protein
MISVAVDAGALPLRPCLFLCPLELEAVLSIDEALSVRLF